jgi:predicted amidohydrolase YtcJ
MRLAIERIGPVRATYIYPAGSILRDGGKLAYGADWSVASANPLEGIEIALTRVAPGGKLPPLLPKEAVSLPQALRAYIINVAYVNHLDKQTRSILPSKWADLIVLDHNLFEIRPTQIHEAKVLVTLFEGREVFGTMQALNIR